MSTSDLLSVAVSILAILVSLASLQISRLAQARAARGAGDRAKVRAMRRWMWPLRAILGEP